MLSLFNNAYTKATIISHGLFLLGGFSLISLSDLSAYRLGLLTLGVGVMGIGTEIYTIIKSYPTLRPNVEVETSISTTLYLSIAVLGLSVVILSDSNVGMTLGGLFTLLALVSSLSGLLHSWFLRPSSPKK